jgi:hypothetical protein
MRGQMIDEGPDEGPDEGLDDLQRLQRLLLKS